MRVVRSTGHHEAMTSVPQHHAPSTSRTQLDDLDEAALVQLYAPPRSPWWRLNFVATVDGAVAGADGLSKSIHNAADQRVFQALRRQADAIVVGAGTIRDEAYAPNPKPLVVVSRSAAMPPSLLAGPLDQVWMATGARAEHLTSTQELLGERMLVLGEETPDLTTLHTELTVRGFSQILCEGGPSLARDLLAAGLVDELCLTVVASLVSGDQRRLLAGGDLDLRLELAGMLQQDSTLLQRWLVVRD